MTENSVFLDSPSEGANYRTFCMFKVNMSSNANCSFLRLQHRGANVSEEEDVDSLNESSQAVRNEISTDSDECRDYLEIWDRKICLSDLANPGVLPLVDADSFVAFFWTDDTRDENRITPFDIRAECGVYSS